MKNRDKQPQFFDKHLSKTRKIQFRILMRSDALWYSDHSSSGPRPGLPQSRTQSMPVRRLGAGHDSGETEYRISNFGYPVSCAHAHAQTAILNSRGRH